MKRIQNLPSLGLSSCNLCVGCGLVFVRNKRESLADDWPEWRGAGRDGDWNETGLVENFENGSLEVLWSQPVSSGYSGPTVAGGLVCVIPACLETSK